MTIDPAHPTTTAPGTTAPADAVRPGQAMPGGPGNLEPRLFPRQTTWTVPPALPYPPGPPAEPGRHRQRRTVAGIAALAVLAAAFGGGIGGLVGYAATTQGATTVLGQPLPPVDAAAPIGAVTAVAQRVLPSVVQLVGQGGEGSGVVLSAGGLILTNNHVLDPARGGALTAVLHDGTRAPVEVVGTDPSADLAVVRAQGVSGLTPVVFGNSDGLQVGQPVVAVGSPLGLTGTVTSGIVSALNRPVAAGAANGSTNSALDVIQTDAAINPGNSGGPLVDLQGRVVGINSAIATLGGNGSQQGGSIGLGFAIPINIAKRVADELGRTGHATHAVLGISIADASPSGAQVTQVQPGSTAEQGGLRPGDVVAAIDGRAVSDGRALVAAVQSRDPGTTAALTVSGPGGTRTVTIALGSVSTG